MIDHEIDRDLRVDLGGVAAQLADRVAHRCQIDHARHTGEILQQHPGRAELDFLAGARIILPVGDCLRVLGRDGEATILETQHVLEQDLEAERQLRHVADGLGRLGEGIIGVFLAPYRQSGAGSERVLADLGHACVNPSWVEPSPDQ